MTCSVQESGLYLEELDCTHFACALNSQSGEIGGAPP